MNSSTELAFTKGVLDGIAKWCDDLAAAAAEAHRLQGEHQEDVVMSLFDALSEHNPQLAVRWIELLGERREQRG